MTNDWFQITVTKKFAVIIMDHVPGITFVGLSGAGIAMQCFAQTEFYRGCGLGFVFASIAMSLSHRPLSGAPNAK